ncbi:hypothetical protein XENOCAPTIV_021409 [Xenoophorus captivus]|uniref:Zinc finger protein 346 n=1 Tax=Xenoophorus captivus TaxID=1517983 RepID=A0ABV0QKK7_9TELE
MEKPADNTGGVPEADNNNPDRYCSTCKASFNNPLMAQQHYAGKKHKKHMTRLKLMETYKPSTAPGQNLVSCLHILVVTLQRSKESNGAFHVLFIGPRQVGLRVTCVTLFTVNLDLRGAREDASTLFTATDSQE